jgi:hypothetical protein
MNIMKGGWRMEDGGAGGGGGPSGVKERFLELIVCVGFEGLIQEANVSASFQGSYIFFEQFPLVTRLLFCRKKLRLCIQLFHLHFLP